MGLLAAWRVTRRLDEKRAAGKACGRRRAPTRTLIVTSFKAGDRLRQNYQAADHDVVVTQPTHRARLAHNREDGRVAYLPRWKSRGAPTSESSGGARTCGFT
ncbi:hypothetical protein [Pseudomonas asplenii]|uniref:hypothetical protein n=1 Tax=Pseudomonas asplenii TaxID=53407 RepID=UPI00035E0882